jgi:hypothetical protein
MFTKLSSGCVDGWSRLMGKMRKNHFWYGAVQARGLVGNRCVGSQIFAGGGGEAAVADVRRNTRVVPVLMSRERRVPRRLRPQH